MCVHAWCKERKQWSELLNCFRGNWFALGAAADIHPKLWLIKRKGMCQDNWLTFKLFHLLDLHLMSIIRHRLQTCLTRYGVCLLLSLWSMWPSYQYQSKSVETQPWKNRLTPCPVSLNEKNVSWEMKEKCSSHCHHHQRAALSGLTLALKWEWPHHTFSQIIINDMILSLADSFFFSWAVLHFAWVCGSVPLLSGPPDSALTVRQRSRKMAVIHFVPRHRQGSFSLLPITSRPDYASQQDAAAAAALSGPDQPPYFGRPGLADDPLRILPAPPVIIRGNPLHLQEEGNEEKKKDCSQSE